MQPGRADFVDEMTRSSPISPSPTSASPSIPNGTSAAGEVPGEVIGSVDARVVNRVAERLSEIVAENDLPQKLLIVHRFTADMVVGPERLRAYPGVAMVLNVDGFGDPAEQDRQVRGA